MITGVKVDEVIKLKGKEVKEILPNLDRDDKYPPLSDYGLDDRFYTYEYDYLDGSGFCYVVLDAKKKKGKIYKCHWVKSGTNEDEKVMKNGKRRRNDRS